MSDEVAGRGEGVDLGLAHLAEIGLLTASLVHELRQPLFALRATAELALAGGSQDAARWKGVLEQTGHLEELVERFGGGGHDTDAAPGDVNDAVARAVRMLDHRARRVGAEVRLALADAPVVAEAGDGVLRQIVVNLLQNALDAVEGREERRVELHTTRTRGRVSLRIEDSGGGVPHEVLARLFEPFVTGKAAGRGTGLGLYITRALVLRAGGVVQLASEPGAGTVVRVELPAAG